MISMGCIAHVPIIRDRPHEFRWEPEVYILGFCRGDLAIWGVDRSGSLPLRRAYSTNHQVYG